jgi:hypothetical protein
VKTVRKKRAEKTNTVPWNEAKCVEG